MRRSVRAIAAVFSSVLVLAASSSLAVAKPPVRAPAIEAKAPVPTGAEARRLAALHAGEGKIETSDRIAAAVVTHTVLVKIAADEEWRAFYGSAWQTEANARLERADDAMFSQFGIDLVKNNAVTWVTNSSGLRRICGVAASLLDELQYDISIGSNDVVIGFTDSAAADQGQGCAQGNYAVVDLHGSTTAARVANVWKTLQHEVSHFFGAPDRYGAYAEVHRDDVMEDHYRTPDFWCTQDGFEDWVIVHSHRAKYD